MESTIGTRFENCHRKHLAVFWFSKWKYIDKIGVVNRLIRQTEHFVAQFYPWFKHVFFFLLKTHHTLPWPKTKIKHMPLPVSCQCFWPSIGFALVLIPLFSQPTHLIPLSTLTTGNPIFIFHLKTSSYNPIFSFFTELLNPWLPVVLSFVLSLCLQKHWRKGLTWSVKKKMWIVITR